MNELPKQEEDALRTWLQQAREPEISHDELVAYLRCQTNHELTQKIESVKTGNANIRLLFDLIDQERDKAKVKTSQHKGLNYPRIPRKVEALLQQISAGQSSRKDAQQFIDGLTFSPLFYRQVLRRIAVALAEPERDEETGKLPATVRNEILQTVLSDAEPGNQGGFLAVTSRTASNIWQDIRRLPDLIVSPKAGIMAAAAMGLFLVFFTGRPLYLNWQSVKFAQKGIAYLAQNHFISSREEPRPTGGFNYFEFGRTRGKSPALDSANIFLQKALNNNRENSLGHQYLGTYYLLVEKNVEKAHEEYLFAYKQDSTDAGILNDMGVLAWKQGRLTQAADFFVRASQSDSILLEAKYNLATVYQRLEQTENTKTAWNIYLQQDSTSIWADIARDRLDQLK